MSHSEQLNELAAALCAAQAEFSAIPKTDDNPFFKSKFAGLPIVVKTASPILTKHGLSVSQFLGADDQGHDTLTTWLLHKSGQFIADSMRLHLVKNDPQGQGSATTYARRYSYMAALGLVADVDDDGNAGSAPARQQRNGRAATPSLPQLDDAAVAIVAQAVKAASPGQERLRTELVALGVSHVPEGAITKATLRGLSEDQARSLVEWCNAQTEAATA